MNFKAEFEIPDRAVQTDIDLLERIIGDLYLNAIQACSSGANIKLVAQLEVDGDLVFTVEDDGPGVSDENAKHIFDPYYSERQSGPNGSGLGLAICRLAAKSLGGSIKHFPRQPTGARFVVTLPTEQARISTH